MFRVLVLVLFVLRFSDAAHASSEQCFKLSQAVPEAVGDLKKTQMTDFEKDNPGLGYSVRYEAGYLRLTVFIFDAGYPTIGQDIARAYFDGAVQDVATAAQRRSAGLGDIDAVLFRPPRGNVTYFAKTTSSDGLSEIVTLGTEPGCMIKMRFTTRLPLENTETAFWQLAEQVSRDLETY